MISFIIYYYLYFIIIIFFIEETAQFTAFLRDPADR